MLDCISFFPQEDQHLAGPGGHRDPHRLPPPSAKGVLGWQDTGHQTLARSISCQVQTQWQHAGRLALTVEGFTPEFGQEATWGPIPRVVGWLLARHHCWLLLGASGHWVLFLGQIPSTENGQRGVPSLVAEETHVEC